MRNNNTHFLKIFQTFIFTFCFLIPGFCWGNTSDQIKNGDSFVNYIMFNGESSLIAYYVPETYDSLVPTKMILALHYCGENSASSAIIYRNLLKELAETINAVIVSPDCHNYGPPSYSIPDPSIITVAIDSTMAFLNIDPSQIYLTGGSCNGKSTFEYGLDGIYDFVGIIPFNSWIPNIPPGQYNFNSDIPSCICSGTLDPNYANNVIMYDSLVSNNSITKLNSIEGVGHTFNFPEFTDEMKECIDFIDSVEYYPVYNTTLRKGVNEIIIYPNPTTENFKIQITSKYPNNIRIDCVDLNGFGNSILYEGKIDEGSNTIYIDDASLFKPGLNIINLTGERWTKTIKVMFLGDTH